MDLARCTYALLTTHLAGKLVVRAEDCDRHFPGTLPDIILLLTFFWVQSSLLPS